jgi:hypothetical protein
MATEYEEDGVRIVKPSLSEWRLKEHEKWLLEQSDSIPNWRLADKCRRLLADTTSHLSASLPDDSHSKTVAELKPRAREYAASRLAESPSARPGASWSRLDRATLSRLRAVCAG